MDEDALADRARQLYAWDNRIAVLTALDDAQARITELERQRDAVLALHQRREDHIVCAYDDEIWPCPTATALGVQEDENGQPIGGGE